MYNVHEDLLECVKMRETPMFPTEMTVCV
jgi:hypothetical protein